MDMEKINAAAARYKTQIAVDSAVDEWRVQHQAEAEAEEAAKPYTERVSETIDEMGSAISQTAGEALDFAQRTANDVSQSFRTLGGQLNQMGEAWQEHLHQGANLQEAWQNGTFSQENVEQSQQAAENYLEEASKVPEAAANIPKAVVRQTARAFINNYANDNESAFQPLAESLEQSDANLNYFMTSEEKLAKARQIESEVGIPAEAVLSDDKAYKAALEVYNFKKRKENIEDVWQEFPEIKDIASLDPQAAALALHDIDNVRKTHGIVESFTHFLERGNIKLEYDNLQYKIMQGKADENDIQRAEDLKKMLDNDKKEAPSFWDDPAAAMAAGVAQSIPEMGQGIKEGVEDAAPAMAAAVALTLATGGTGGLALAGAAGVGALRAMIMRAIASQGVKTVGKRAFQVGMFKGMAEAERGSRYAEMGEMKDKDGNPLYTDDERRFWSFFGGSANAGIEMLDFGLITKALSPTPHAARVFEDIVKNTAVKKTQREKIAEMVGGRAKDWLKLTAAESGEEALQSVSDDLIHNAAVSSTGERGSNIKQYSAKDIAGRAGAAFVESIPGSMGFATVGAGGGMVGRAGVMARNARREARIAQQYGENAVQTMNGTIMVEQLQQAVASGKLKETAPDVQKKILREQLADTGYEMAYIDVETALQKESGVEDLKKVAKANGMSNEDLDTAISQQGFISVPTEVLAQVENTPDLLDSVTFKPDAESMARMRMNQKELTEAYNEAIKRTLDNRQQLIQNIISQVLPENATKEQKEMLETAIMMNPDNPAQGFAELRKAAKAEWKELLAPAIHAMKEGARKGRLLDIQDEQGNIKTIPTPGENATWYSNFYNMFHRYPTETEYEEMAVALLTGDPSAPEVQGWTIDSAEAQQGMEQNKANINRIRGNLKALQEIKDAAEKLTGVEMQLTEGLTPEGFKMYRQLSDWLRNVGGATARQARMGAILAARHADIYAAKVTERTGKKYTAEDYMRDKIGFSVRRADVGLNQREAVPNLTVKSGKIKADDGKSAMKKALDWFVEQYPKGTVAKTSMGDVHITKSGIKDSLSHGFSQKKLDVIPSLKKGLEQADFMKTIADYDNGRIKNHFLVYEVSIDGEKNLVLCRVREQDNYKKLYVHEVATPEQVQEKSKTLHAGGADNGVTPRGLALYTSILREYLEKVNVNILNQQAANNTLAAYHNTRVDNLEKLLEQGLAVPSIAITHKNIPYDNFGDVTLIGNRNLIDPESGVPVWTRDAYTTRIPRAEYLPTEKKKIKAFMDKWRKNLQGIGEGEYVLDRLEEAAQEDPERVEARTHRDEFTYYYLTKVLGRDVELKHIRPDYEVPILRNGIYAGQIESIMHSKKKKADKKKALTEVFIVRYEKALAEYAESIPKKKAYLDAQPSPKRKMMYEKALERQREKQDNLAAIKQTGEISEEQYKEIQKDISRVDKAEKESTEIDWGKTFSEMRANNKDALNSDKYQQWQDKLLDDIRGDAVIKIGRKYEPYTTDNIVRAMLKERGAAQEDVGGFSTSKAAAMGATSLKSIADLHKNESRLVTHEQANKVIADVDTAINDSFEGVREYHKNIAADSYSLPEIYNEAVANAIKGGKKATAANVKAALKKMEFDVAKIPTSAIDDVVNAANQMRDAAAWYFEAKPQRAVGINEFSGAVVPEDTPAEIIQKLEDNGLTVETYNPEIAGDRQRATRAIQDARVETLFQSAWHGSPYDFETFDLGAIGSGEGNQVHGWGLYFAANRAVSEEYKEVLGQSQGKKLYIDGKEHEWSSDNVKDKAMKALISTVRSVGDVSKVRQKLEKLKQTNEVKQAIKYIDEGRVNVDYPGKLFQVEIPDNDVLLDEQKTFSQQPEKVRKVILKLLGEGKIIKEFAKYGENAKKVAEKIIDTNIAYEDTYELFNQLSDMQIDDDLIDRLDRVRGKLDKYSTGEAFYRYLSQKEGGPKYASELLNKNGVKGITYEGGTDGRCFVVFDDKAIDIIEKYNQQVAQQQIKGQTTLQVNGKRIVSILESADESTFMHEMAHVFLYDLQDLAQIDDTSAKELEIVNEWANWQKGAAAEYKSTPWAREFAQLEQEIIDAEAHGDFDTAEQKKRQWRQERFARGFELYLKDGQAPAKGLKAVFRKFKQFLRQIYAAFVTDGGKPTLPVKRVMDRMIATEQEIEAMELEDRYADVQKAGGAKLFDESEEDTYNRWYEEASAEAKENLLKIVMKDLEKEKQAQFDLQMEEERNRKRNELQQEPVYLAERAVMAGGDESIVRNWFTSVDEFKAALASTVPLEEALQEHMDKFAQDLDARLIEDHLSPEAVDKAMKSSKYRVKLESLKGKAMAKKLGLINRINSKAEKAMESIEEKLTALPEETDLKVDAQSDGVKSVMQEINKLRYSAKWNAEELGHIESMIRASTQDEVRAALKELKENKAQDKQREEEILKANEGRQAIFRDMARESMAMKPISESCNVNYYMQQEKKMARRVRDMIRAKRWDMAMRAQEQQGVYAAMAEMAEKNREQRNKLLSQVNRELNARTVRLPKNERYWHRHLAYILRIAKTDATPPTEGFVQLNDLLQSMADSLDILEHSLDNILVMANKGEDFKGYQDLTLDEFKEAVESLHVLYTVGRDKFKMKTIDGKNLLDVIAEITSEENTVAQNVEVDTRKVNPDKGGVGYSELIGNTGDTGHLIAKRGQDYIISSLKPENILKMLGNAAHRYIYGTLERAAENEAKMQAANIEALREIMSVYTHKERQEWTKKIYDLSTEKGDKISKEQIMCMALNWGTMSNRQRLLGGLASDERTPEAVARMTEEVMRLFQETMTARDWQVVQKLWDHIGTYWEDTVKVEEKLNGITLEKIPANKFTILTADGQEIELAGGYMPVKYAPEKSARAEEHEVNEMAQSITAGAQRYGVGRGFTKSRSEFDIFRPLKLEFGVVEEHLQNVIHNATYRLPVRDVYRLVTNTDFENFVTNHLGREYHKILRDWAVDVWKQVNPNTNTADNVLSQGLGMLRRSATMSIMGYRIWPVIENISNISVASARIGTGQMAAALGDFYTDLRGNFNIVKKKSLFMRNRLDNLDRDIRSQAGIFRADNKLFEVARDHAYDLMVYSDLMVSAPLWMRAYKNAYEPMVNKVKEENEKNIAYLIKCQQEVDRIRAEIADLRGEAKAMDEHLKDRRYASPETAEALRQSPFAIHTDNDLRALSGENIKRAKAMEKDLWAAEVAFQEAQEIKILSDDEVLDEAEQRAVFEADGVIRDTFGSGRTLDLPAVQRSRNEITKLLTTFYGFFNTQFNAVYMSYVNSRYLPAQNAIEKWAPFAKQIMFRFVFTALIGSLLQYGLGLAGNDDDDKKRKVKDANGKEVEVDIPGYERFLKVFAKNSISTATGSMYLVRDAVNAAMDFIIKGKSYGMNTGSVAGRGASEFGKMFMLLAKKGQRDAEIQAKEEKRQKTHEEKLKKYKGKKRQEYLKKWEEEQQYQKPPKRITYTEIAGHGLKAASSLTAANTGVTSTMVNAITSTMQYMLDSDMRYDPSWKNIIWSAVFDKKPVEREIPKKPEKEPKKKGKGKRKANSPNSTNK